VAGAAVEENTVPPWRGLKTVEAKSLWVKLGDGDVPVINTVQEAGSGKGLETAALLRVAML
jgi:hypothetical protein